MFGHEKEPPLNSIEMAAHILADQAFAVIDTKYGPDGQSPKGYHNVVHSRDYVVGGIIELADLMVARGKITPRDKALLTVGGAFHDVEQDLGSGTNEAASAQAAISAMREAGVFTPSDESVVEEVIMGTIIDFKDGVMLQSASENNLLAQIVADADLSPLGRDTRTYWDSSFDIFTELYGDNPTTENQVLFLNNQVR
jgi:predicted metal-dependent HD superfamily phosphohydrolase